MSVTAHQLRVAQDRVGRAQRDRDALILRAVAEGRTQAWVAEATGLSTGRVSQIKSEAER